jgi:8-oxo-dGTP pyrophosphatase MutT (NUDIX family)
MTVDIRTIGTRLVYENRWMRVREDMVVRRDGSQGIYGVVEKPDFVTIAALDGGRVHLVQQYRYPVQDRYWELPQGSWEQAPGSDPLQVARAELREETGIEATEMVYAGHLFQATRRRAITSFSPRACSMVRQSVSARNRISSPTLSRYMKLKK